MSRPCPRYTQTFPSQSVILLPERRLILDGSPTRVMPQRKDNQNEHEPDKEDTREALDRATGRQCHDRFVGYRDIRSFAYSPKRCWRPTRVCRAVNLVSPGRPTRVCQAVGIPCRVRIPQQRRYRITGLSGRVQLLQLWHWLDVMLICGARRARSWHSLKAYPATHDLSSSGRSHGHLVTTV